jgi:hypothetical protein
MPRASSKKQLSGSSSASAAVQELTRLSEQELQTKIIEPLLNALGFDNITDTSGARERGKDLVATKKNDFDRDELFAIQIKRWKPDAKAASSRSFGLLLNQLAQAIKEPVVNPSTRERQRPNKCLFVTPFPIPARAHEDYQQRMLEIMNSGAEIIDGPRIVQLLLKNSPATLAAFSMDVQYRLRLARAVTRVPKARTAFEGSTEVDSERIYVAVNVVEDQVIDVLTKSAPTRPVTMPMTQSELAEVYSLLAMSNVPVSSPITLLSTKQPGERAEVDVRSLLAAIRDFISEYAASRRALNSKDTSNAECTKIAQDSIRIRGHLKYLMRNKYLDRAIQLLISDHAHVHAPVSISLNTLLRVDCPSFLLGGPGAGKSTAMRWLTRSAAQKEGTPLPILIPLSGVKEPSHGVLLQRCADQLQEHGYYGSDTKARLRSLEQMLQQGHVRLLLDGLDEVGSIASRLVHTIDLLATHYPKTPIIVSCRDTLRVDPWEKAFTVHLQAFSDEQISEFIRNWFRVGVKALQLIGWLRGKPSMLEAARTPLITALLCSLF